MTTLVLPAVGAGIGFFVGGSTGAQVGWVLGSYLANTQTKISQDQLGDLTIQTSQYGTIIPFVIGKQRVTGNIIWTSPKTTYTFTSSGGKGGGPQTVSTGYKISLAIALCKGPILGISRVWADGTLIIDSGNTVGTIYTGANDQLPDPTIQGYEGAANVPAYRGLAYTVLKDYDLGVTGRIPQLSFEVIKQGGV